MLTQLGWLVFVRTCEARCSLTNLFVDAVAVCLDVAFDSSRSTVVTMPGGSGTKGVSTAMFAQTLMYVHDGLVIASLLCASLN